MSTIRHALALSLSFAFAASAGPLSPPAGPPAPTDLPRVQCGPRTPFSEVGGSSTSGYLVSGGSYYLSGNLNISSPNNSSLRITGDDVDIDLGGHTIRVTFGNPSVPAIRITGKRVALRNGTIETDRDTAVAVESLGRNVLLENLHIVSTGKDGIDNTTSGGHLRVLGCTVSGFSSRGIVNTAGSVERCVVEAFSGQIGIQTSRGVSVRDSVVIWGDTGFSVFDAQGCTAVQAVGVGFAIGAEGIAEGCTVVARPYVSSIGFDAADRSAIRGGQVFGLQSIATGVRAGSSVEISSTRVHQSNGAGISAQNYATITDSSAIECLGNGIVTGPFATVSRSSAIRNSGAGIVVDASSTVDSCTSLLNSSDGFQLAQSSRATHCLSSGNANGYVTTPNGNAGGVVLDSNAASMNFQAQYVLAGPGNVVTRNHARGPFPFEGFADDIFGEVVSAPGVLTGSTSPWANFEY